MMHPSDLPWWKTHSADYVLGLLSNSERLVFERIMQIEPELQGFVVDWREKLQPMSDALPPIKPPEHILPALISNIPIATNHDNGTEGSFVTQDTAIPNGRNGNASVANLAVASGSTASVNHETSSGNEPNAESANQSIATVPDQSRHQTNIQSEVQNNTNENANANANVSATDLADGTAFMRMLEKKQAGIDAWRSYAGLATASALLVALLGWVGFNKAQTNKAEPTFDGISVIKNSDEKAIWVVDSSVGAKTLRVTAVAPPALEADQAFELWMVKPNDGGVVSMGLLPSTANTTSRINVHRFNDEAESFGVSVESVNGSPESIPSGPVLFQGNIHPVVD